MLLVGKRKQKERVTIKKETSSDKIKRKQSETQCKT